MPNIRLPKQKNTEPPEATKTSGTRETIAAAAGNLWSLLIRALPFVAGYVAFRASGSTAIKNSSDEALRNIGTLLQWALGLIAGIAAYTLIGEVTLRRLPTQISTMLDTTSRDLKALEQEISELRTITGEQVKIATDLRGLEIVYELDDALRRARRLQSSATSSVRAMWALLPYDDPLRDYFAEALDACPFTQRVIAASNVAKHDLRDHIERSWEHLAAQRYEIYIVHQCNYEAMVVDHKRGGLFLISDRGFGSGYISINTEEFSRLVEGLIEGLMAPTSCLPVRRGEAYDFDKLSDWLDTYYESD